MCPHAGAVARREDPTVSAGDGIGADFQFLLSRQPQLQAANHRQAAMEARATIQDSYGPIFQVIDAHGHVVDEDLEVAQVEDVGARFEGVVTYHDSCHALRELHVQEGPRRLLANVRGLGGRDVVDRHGADVLTLPVDDPGVVRRAHTP